MTYEEFVTQLQGRGLAALNQVRDALIAAGLAANRVTVTVPDTVDFRLQLTATRAGRTLTVYIELTDSSHLGGVQEGKAILTLWIAGNNAEITHNYQAGTVVSYLDSDSIDSLVAKLGQLEAEIPNAITKIRAFMGL